MKPAQQETAYYQENFNTNQFKWVAYGAFGYGSTYDEAHEDAKRKVYRKCKEENPHLNFDEVIQVDKPNKMFEGLKPTHVFIPEGVTVEKIDKGAIEDQIRACTEIEGKEDHQLKSYKLFVEMNKKYKPVYDEKLTELKRSGVIRKSKTV